MSEPLPSARLPETDGGADRDRDAKIEELLVAGLDQYFAGEYEQAINVWTRALFLDRSHARARAYIERARSAIAERQRESEELLERGRSAFHRGEAELARRLLQDAVTSGAHRDEALALLDRLDRIGQCAAPAPTPVGLPSHRPTSLAGREAAPPRRSIGWAVGAAVLVLLAAVAGVMTADGLGWRTSMVLQPAPVSPASAGAAVSALPVPRRGEAVLSRARALAATGRLRDALMTLELVRHTDPERGDADRLKGQIQQQLIGLLAPSVPPPADEPPGGAPLP